MPDYRLPDGTVPVLMSSDTTDGLRAEATAILDYLRRRPAVTPDAVADTLFRTRTARRKRALAMVGSRTELLDALAAIALDRPHPRVTVGRATPRRVGFVFPGQGSQNPGMGKLYYDHSPAYRAEVDACAAIHLERYGHDQPLNYLLGNDGGYRDRVWEVQPALMFHMAGLAAMWQAHGVQPAATVGHSQGELAAAWISRVMTRRDAVLAVTHRARLVDEQVEEGVYSMAVLGVDRDECEALLARHRGWVELSVINSAHILAVAGEREAILDVVATLDAGGKFAKEIKVAYPAHTSYLNPFREKAEGMLGDEMSSPTFAATRITCFGATLGAAITPDLTHRQYWYWNLRNRVRFDRAVIEAAREVDTFIEVAEHPTLHLAIQENLAAVPHDARGPRDFQVLGTSRRTAVGLEEFTKALAQVAVHDLNYDWNALRVPGSAVRVPPPNFPHTRMSPKRLWAPYRRDADAPGHATVAPARITEKWVRLRSRTSIPARTVVIVDRDGGCAELATAIGERAERYGATVSLFDGTRVRDCDTVVVLHAPGTATDPGAAVTEFAEFATDQHWRAAIGAGVRQCWLVTSGAEAVHDDDLPALPAAAAASAFRGIALEHLGVSFRHLDLPREHPEGGTRRLADRVLDALHLADEPELAVRSGTLHAKRFETHDPAATAEHDLTQVLILGGTGHVGLEFCRHLTGAGATRITLVGRRGETPRVSAELRPLRALGTTDIDVVSCDIADGEAVAALARRFDGGDAVTMLVHAAVDYVYAAAADTDRAAVIRSATAKVIGLSDTLTALPMTQDATILLCSSFAASLGGWGQAVYAGTNRMLDALAFTLRARGRRCASVQWGLWVLPEQADDAIHARIQSAGLLPMDPAAAVTAGLADPTGNSLVLAADWSRMRELTEIIGLAPVFGAVFDEFEGAPPSVASVAAPAAAPETITTTTPSAPLPEPANIAELIRRELDRVMLTDGTEPIDESVPLVSLGMDSQQALDLRARIKAELHRDLPVTAILGGASFDDVVALMTATEG